MSLVHLVGVCMWLWV